ncbi:MAG: hypothetical protein R2843_15895 [Thermomicrobiales bacterium]
MILVPIMLTWFALAQAVSDYSNYVERYPEQIGQPFLLLWQQGFGGEASWHSPSFSSVAILDAMVILLIVVITFFAHGRREEREEDIAMTARDFQAHLDNALGEATVRFAMARNDEAERDGRSDRPGHQPLRYHRAGTADAAAR